MVFVVTRAGDDELCTGLRPEDAARLRDAIEFVREPYVGKQVPTGQDAMDFSRDVVAALASLKLRARAISHYVTHARLLIFMHHSLIGSVSGS